MSDADVLDAVRARWSSEAIGLTYLPVGFGAHHWQACDAEGPRWFVTLDLLKGTRHNRQSLDDAYRSAARLAEVLPFVHGGLPPTTVALGHHVLSVTAWLAGVRPDGLDIATTSDLLDRLHSTAPPPQLPRWSPLVRADLGDWMSDAVREPWTNGPHGERARQELASRLGAISTWTAHYHRLADRARPRPWVVTHGEPHERNQVVTATGTMLVDWESVKLAPAERDLRTVGTGEAEMLELFDLEWRLDEITQYATWFQDPHTGSADDQTALDGLIDGLDARR